MLAVVGTFQHAPQVIAQTQAYWLNPVTGSWFDPINWSTNPAYPDNGQPLSGDLYAVTIDATGSAYQPYINSASRDLLLDSLLINSPDATLLVDTLAPAGMTVTNGIEIRQGTLHLYSVAIRDTAINGSGKVRVHSLQSNILDNVSIGGDLTFYNGGTFSVLDTVLFQNANLRFGTTANSGGAYFRGWDEAAAVEGDLNLMGAATLSFYESGSFRAGSESTLTIGQDLVIHAVNHYVTFTGGTIVNQGQIIASKDRTSTGWVVSFAADRMENHGLIRADSQNERVRIAMSESFENAGLIEAINGGGFEIFAPMTTAQLGEFQVVSDSKIELFGPLDNTGDDLNITAASGSLTVHELIGGRVVANQGVALKAAGVLDGVAVNGVVRAVGDVEVRNGLTFETAESRLLITNPRDLFADGGQSIAGPGTINFSYARGWQPASWGDSLAGDLVFESEVNVEFSYDGNNPSLSDGSTTIQMDGVVNRGTFSFVDPDADITFDGDFTNEGFIRVLAGQAAFINGLNNQGLLSAQGGKILLRGGNVAAGDISASNGGQIVWTGTYGPSEIGTFVNDGGSLILDGVFDLSGQTYDLASAFSVGKTPVHLKGVVANGTLQDSSGDPLTVEFNGSGNAPARMQDMTIDLDVQVGLRELSLAGDVEIGAGRTIALGIPSEVRGVLSLQPNSTLDGPGRVLAIGPGQVPTSLSSWTTIGGRNSAFTLGPSLTVETQTGSLMVGGFDSVWENQGLIRAGAGDTVLLYGDWTNTGTILAEGTVLLGDKYLNLSRFGQIQKAETGDVVLTGRLNLEGQTFDPNSLVNGQWTSQNYSKVYNGRIETPTGPFTLNASVLWLENITLAGDFAVTGGGSVSLYPSFVMDNAILRLGDADSHGYARFESGTTGIVGSGEIVLDGEFTSLIWLGHQNSFSIGADIMIRNVSGSGQFAYGFAPITNHGFIASEGGVLSLTGNSFNNAQGTLAALGGVLVVQGLTGNAGQLGLAENSRLEIASGVYQINQDVFVPGGAMLRLGGNATLNANIHVPTDATLRIAGLLTNNGAVNLNGGTIELQTLPSFSGTGSYNFNSGTASVVGSFTTAGLRGIGIGNLAMQVQKTGEINNAGETFSVGIGGDAYTLDFYGGRLDGGIIRNDGFTPIVIQQEDNATTQFWNVERIDPDVFVQADAALDLFATKTYGLINVAPGGRLRWQGIGWENRGGVYADGAEVVLSGTIGSIGQFELDNTTLFIQTQVEVDTLYAAITLNDSLLILQGTLGLADSTWNLDEVPQIPEIYGGKIQNGTIATSNGEVLNFYGPSFSYLSNVILQNTDPPGGGPEVIVHPEAGLQINDSQWYGLIRVMSGAWLDLVGPNNANYGEVEVTEGGVQLSGYFLPLDDPPGPNDDPPFRSRSTLPIRPRSWATSRWTAR